MLRAIEISLQTIVLEFFGVVLGDIDVAQQPGQNIVEVVGNPTGQLTNCFHALRMPQLVFKHGAAVFGSFAFSDVAHHLQNMGAAMHIDHHRAVFAKHRGTVFASAVSFVARAPGISDFRVERVGFFLVRYKFKNAAADEFLARIAADAEHGWIDIDDGGVGLH